MANSSLSSLGLGSSGVLSYDVIDKLRAVDEKAQITPIDNKITSNTTKQKDLSALTTLTASLKSATSALSDEMSYLKRTATVSNSAVSVTAASGSGIQDFTLHVNQLAQRDIYQTKGFTAESTALGLSAGKLSISVGTTSYDIDVTASTTLSELKDKINDVAGEKVTASILNVGGSEPYKLVVKSDETGTENTITFGETTSSGILTALKLNDSTNHIMTAQNAKFTYNNVAIERKANTIDDLVVGLSITLNTQQEATETTTVSVKQNTDDIKDSLTSLVSAYNDLIANLNEATKYDNETKASGTFQGVSQITSLSADIRKQLLSIDASGRSLTDYGLTLNEGGLLELNSATFEQKMTSDSSDVESFFRGKTDSEGNIVNGFFTDFNDLLAGYISDDKSILSLYQTSLTSEKSALTKEREKTVSRLDARYETMASRFAAYDSIINKLNTQFNTLSQMIDAAANSNN